MVIGRNFKSWLLVVHSDYYPTGGGDWEECYELVLHEAREKLSWTPGTQRSLVMIGDAIPHPPTYAMNTKKLDWKVEAKKLHDEAGVKVYAVQALNNSGKDGGTYS